MNGFMQNMGVNPSISQLIAMGAHPGLPGFNGAGPLNNIMPAVNMGAFAGVPQMDNGSFMQSLNSGMFANQYNLSQM